MNRLTFEQPKSKSSARNVADIGAARSQLTLALAQRLKTIAESFDDQKAGYKALKLQRCGEKPNIWVGIDLHNSDGECFDGVGALWACRLGYCQNCESAKAALNRRGVRDFLQRYKQPVGTNWNFITLTAPSVPVPLLASIQVYLRAWDLFRQRKWFVETVDAGWRGLEFTVNKETGQAHVHIHALASAKFIYPSDVRREWQACITKAWREWSKANKKRVSLVFPASGAVVDIREIKRGNHSAIDSAILECCKYSGKGSAWLALSDADLLAVSQLPKLSRLFASFGKAHGKSKSNADTLNRLDKNTIKAGDWVKPKGRKKIHIPQLKVDLARAWRKAQLIERYPQAHFKTIDGRSFTPSFVPVERKLKLIKPKEQKQ